MNFQRFFGVVLIGLLVFALQTFGQPGQSEQKQRRPDGSLPPGFIEKLSDSQKETAAKFHKEFQEKLEAAKKKFAEVLEQAKQNQNRQQAREAQEAFQKRVAKIHEEFRGQLQQMLTTEQKERQAGQDQPGKRGSIYMQRILGQLELTEEQRAKIAGMMKELQEKQEVTRKKIQEAIEQAKQNMDREKVRHLFQDAEKQMARFQDELQAQVRQVLTETQKKTYGELLQRWQNVTRPAGVGPLMPLPLQERLNLTQEQKAKVANLQKEMEAKLRGILTEDQNRQWEQLKSGPSPERRKPRD